MAKPFLVSNPLLTVWDNSGLLVSNGAQVFTYQAGTTTPLTTYQTQTDAVNSTNPNANPIIANSSGRIPALWSTQALKLICAPSTDTNPPVNAYWTIDNITNLSQIVQIATKTSTYSVQVTDRDYLIECDSSGGPFTINLLASSLAGAGFNVKFKKIDSSGNVITIQAHSAETIDGVNSVGLANQWDFADIYNDSTQWLRTYPIPPQSFNDTNGNPELKLVTTASAVDYFKITNAAAGGTPLFSVDGSDTNISMGFNAKGTGQYLMNATATAPATMQLQGQTSNNTNTIGLQAPANVTASATFILPNGDGTVNQFMQTNGSKTLTFASAIRQVNIQAITSSGTYTPTAGMAYCIAEIIGGGGGGGGTSGSGSNSSGGGGGGAGGYIKTLYTAAQVGASAVVTIGAGGAGATAGNNAGGSGTQTTFAAFSGNCIANAAGGGNGAANNTTFQIASGGAAAGASSTVSGTVIVNIGGQAGGLGWGTGTNGLGMGGKGGDLLCYGTGGLTSSFGAGVVGKGFGAGGSGAANGSLSNLAGGAGLAGVVIITEFIQ